MGGEQVGAATLTARLPLLRRSPATAGVEVELLAYHRTGGPLVAVCSLVGGAGGSTLAYMLARRAARHSTAPVLLAELQDQGGLTALTGTPGPVGLRDLANAVVRDDDVARPFAQLPGGLRLVASPHPVPQPPPPAALAHVLRDAREAHGMVVIDGGHVAGADVNVLLEQASHVLFVLPATVAALRRAELLAAAGILDRAGGALATLVAVATEQGRCAHVRQLRRLAERHVERLLLVPHVAELAAGEHQQAEARLENTFAALAMLLRRGR
jgi:cellulose biosynthesis protein BcsQ